MGKFYLSKFCKYIAAGIVITWNLDRLMEVKRMILIISGASCTGKTLLSKRLRENFDIELVSMDSVKMDLYRNDTNCGFTPTSSNLQIAKKIWPIIENEISNAISEKRDLLIEGAYFFPEYLSKLPQEYIKEIHPVFICFSPEYVHSNYDSGILKYRNVAKKRNYVEDRKAEVFMKDHEILKEQCIKENIEYYYIESDYEDEMKKIYDSVAQILDKKF